MVFVVNPQKKRDWNLGWWRDSARGKAILALGIVFAALLVPAIVAAVMLWNPSIDAAPEESLMGILAASAAIFCAAMAFVTFYVVFVRVRRLPERMSSAEVLTIEDGWLTLSYHRRRDPRPRGLDVFMAWLPACEWTWDAAVRKLCLRPRAGQQDAIRDYHYDDPAQQGAVGWESMRPVSAVAFYPFFDPDLFAELKRLGVPEVVQS